MRLGIHMGWVQTDLAWFVPASCVILSYLIYSSELLSIQLGHYYYLSCRTVMRIKIYYICITLYMYITYIYIYIHIYMCNRSILATFPSSYPTKCQPSQVTHCY